MVVKENEKNKHILKIIYLFYVFQTKWEDGAPGMHGGNITLIYELHIH